MSYRVSHPVLLNDNSLRNTLHSLADTYLSSIERRRYTIMRTTTYNNQKYHLVQESIEYSSFLATIAKVVSYSTLILPLLAACVLMLTKSKEHYYNDKAYTYHDLYKALRAEDAKDITTLHQLMPNLFRKKAAGHSSSILQQALSHNDDEAIQCIAKHDLQSFLIPQNRDALWYHASSRYYSVIHKVLNPILLKLNTQTKGDFAQAFKYDQITDLAKNNKELWHALTSKDCAFPLSSSSAEVRKSILLNVYNELNVSLTNNAFFGRSALDPLHPFHPDILSLKGINELNLAMIAFNQGNSLLMDWLLSHHPGLVLDQKNQATFCREVSKVCYQRRAIQQNEMFKKFIARTQGGIFNHLAYTDLEQMKHGNSGLYHYLHSANNPYPLPEHLKAPDSYGFEGFFHRFEGFFSGFFGNTQNAKEQQAGGTHSAGSSVPGLGALSYNDLITQLYTIAKVDRSKYPCNTKKAIRKLYHLAALQVHPDKTGGNQQPFQTLGNYYKAIQNSSAFQHLP